MPKNVKAEFGRLMRFSRDAKGLSRVTLAMRLGISPKTIQSWEMGRTFIERLDLIPQLEVELECSLSALIAKATGAMESGNGEGTQEEPAVSGDEQVDGHHMGTVSQQKLLTRPGPLSPKFSLTTAAYVASGDDADKFEVEWVSVPMLKPYAVLNPVFELQPRDVIRHVIIPREWVPRAGVLVAVRMGDSAMMPMIPLGATVVIDLRPLSLEKTTGRIAAMDFAGKGLRIRRVIRDLTNEKYYGAGMTEHGRANIPIFPDKGDRVIGYIVGVMAAIR